MIGPNLPNWAEVVMAGLSAVTVLTIVFAAAQVAFLNRQIHREFEAMYLARYWVLMDKLSSTYARREVFRRHDKVVALSYFRLCEDQIGLRSRGRVTNHTWQFWSQDIYAQCRGGAFGDVLDSASRGAYPGLERLLAHGGAYDPLDWGWLRKRMRGL